MRLELNQVTRAGEAAAGSEKQQQCTTFADTRESERIVTEAADVLSPYSNKSQ
jgi:hypothetical protein